MVSLLTLPESIVFVSSDVDLGKFTHLNFVWVDSCDDRLLEEFVLLGTVGEWEVQVFLEGYTEGHCNHLVCIVW